MLIRFLLAQDVYTLRFRIKQDKKSGCDKCFSPYKLFFQKTVADPLKYWDDLYLITYRF